MTSSTPAYAGGFAAPRRVTMTSPLSGPSVRSHADHACWMLPWYAYWNCHSTLPVWSTRNTRLLKPSAKSIDPSDSTCIERGSALSWKTVSHW